MTLSVSCSRREFASVAVSAAFEAGTDLKGHGFSRAKSCPFNSAASAAEVGLAAARVSLRALSGPTR